ncbi:MAG: UTP--glucose-1-phosphate uridylyltransferase GalU [Acidaminobacter sp.]|uniref:UTP--glucose-1-phosphate uridylyltransferase GalU n=1 Tax=Acidaminobacter sp. TaxID=1872102 RepID=UPI00138563ED|nr:UTP--glucose-1-phosphate uridylyltransferase GalU [Acidaminobacter sp.]MZQ98229.1 UTP--glucose-1-phosphate uridylyltransferase GalU [Acidaminobacter sp.]
MKVRKAVIPAAGLGTRFLPATKAMPKEMLPIVDKPTIQFIIEEAIASGIEEIMIITGKSKRAIEDHFDQSIELELELEKKQNHELLEIVRSVSEMVDIHYIRQKQPKGLGHAIYCARTFVGNEPFAVLLGDDVVHNAEDPCLGQMIRCYDEVKSTVLGVQEVPHSEVSKYGIVDGMQLSDRVYSVRDLVEKPSAEEAPSNVAILGRYIIKPEIFEILRDTKPGKGGEIQLTDALKELALRDDMYAYSFEGKRYDVGNKQGFLEATVETALRREDLRGVFLEYMIGVVEKETGKTLG